MATAGLALAALSPWHPVRTPPPAVHRARRAGLDAREMRRGLRQHALHEEAAGDELGVHARGVAVAAGELGLRRRRHPAHM